MSRPTTSILAELDSVHSWSPPPEPQTLAGSAVRTLLDLPALALVVVIRIYQLTLSKMLGQVCRFEPSCSRYAVACLADHGALRGSWLAARRLLRCHPFHPGGYDPPPPPRSGSWRSRAAHGLLEASARGGRGAHAHCEHAGLG
jgi:uncharacterized protein